MRYQMRWVGWMVGIAAMALIAGCSDASDPAATPGPVVMPDGTIATATPLPDVPPPNEVPDGMEIVWEAYSLLVREYVDRSRVDPDVLAEAAVRGMLDALDDRYTAYIGPETFHLERQSFDGKFGGIGATVDLTPDGQRIMIVAPLPGTPAEAAGIRAGDVILAVDGEDTRGWSVLDAVTRIRGPEGTPVELTIRHVGQSEPVEITIVRGTIEQRSVAGRMLSDDPYGVLRLTSFTNETVRELREEAQALLDQGAQGLILDVRQNPGGLLTATVDVASEFLSDGLVTYEIDGRGNRQDWRVGSGGRFKDVPLVLLVDGFSASGSEVLAGALQDHGRAVVIGTPTFGKGSVNLLRELSNQGGIYLTVAQWYTPNGRLLEAQGVAPDVVIEFPPNATEDVQMSAAIQQLDFEVGAAALAG